VCPSWIYHIQSKTTKTTNEWFGPKKRTRLTLYVDDVVKLFSSGMLCKLYADDLKLYLVIRTVQDASELQSSLDALVAWPEEWQRSVSSSKSAVLQLSQSTVYQCYKIKQVPVMRDSGILDIKLTMSQHICTIVNKAHSRAILIFKCFHSRDRTTLLKACNLFQAPARIHLPTKSKSIHSTLCGATCTQVAGALLVSYLLQRTITIKSNRPTRHEIHKYGYQKHKEHKNMP